MPKALQWEQVWVSQTHVWCPTLASNLNPVNTPGPGATSWASFTKPDPARGHRDREAFRKVPAQPHSPHSEPSPCPADLAPVTTPRPPFPSDSCLGSWTAPPPHHRAPWAVPPAPPLPHRAPWADPPHTLPHFRLHWLSGGGLALSELSLHLCPQALSPPFSSSYDPRWPCPVPPICFSSLWAPLEGPEGSLLAQRPPTLCLRLHFRERRNLLSSSS